MRSKLAEKGDGISGGHTKGGGMMHFEEKDYHISIEYARPKPLEVNKDRRVISKRDFESRKYLAQEERHQVARTKFIKRYGLSEKLFRILKANRIAKYNWIYFKVTKERFKGGSVAELYKSIRDNEEMSRLLDEFDKIEL